MSLPRIALVTPSFNAGEYLVAAIESVLAQDYPNLDYLVMDGGSTDDSVQILRSFGERIRWISQPDQGQSDALRRGFDKTQGEILGWLNADDTLEPDALHRIGQFFAAHPDVVLAYGNANYVDSHGKWICACAHIESFNKRRLKHYSDFIVQPAAFFRRGAYEVAGGIDPNLHYGMDYDLWLKLADQGKVEHLPVCLANYRWLTDNKTAIGGFGRIEELSAMAHRHGLPEPAYVRLERVNLHLVQARSALMRGRIFASVFSFLQAGQALLNSPRAILSLFQPHTWQVIWTGQVLRARAARQEDAI